MGRLLLLTLPPLLAMYVPTCLPRAVSPSVPPAQVRIEELWQQPENLQSQDLLYGPWGVERAPDPEATYRFVETKRGGANPGMTVRDPAGRVWKVKQPAMDGRIAEGPIEVVLSRVLSAVGYHQPPVYYVADFALEDKAGTRSVPGGRFRLVDATLKDRGEWSWQRNPFVGTRPYQGLLVILLMFNSSDLKNANNTLYEYRGAERPERWFVVRDLGTAMGGTGRITPQRGDIERFERHAFITGVEDGFVTFEYHGWHQELVRHRITPADVRWACALLAALTPTQWREAFLAGGYDTQLAARFIDALQARIRQGADSGRGQWRPYVMNGEFPNLAAHFPSLVHGLLVLTVAGLLGAALGIVRPVRTGIVPRSAHVIQAQILLAIVGAIIIVVVAESLARAFAIVGAAGLVRYRARVEDVKDAGVMLIALALGLTAGGGMFMFAAVACVFVIGVLWLLESLEPPARSRFDLKISTKYASRVRPDIEHALQQKGVTYDLRGSSPTELTYEVTVPFGQKIRPLTKLIRHLDGHAGTLVDWEIKKYETVNP